MDKLKSELTKLGFVQNRKSKWVRKHDIVQIVHSSEYPKVMVTWREYWKDYLALIFDYSSINVLETVICFTGINEAPCLPS